MYPGDHSSTGRRNRVRLAYTSWAEVELFNTAIRRKFRFGAAKKRKFMSTLYEIPWAVHRLGLLWSTIHEGALSRQEGSW